MMCENCLTIDFIMALGMEFLSVRQIEQMLFLKITYLAVFFHIGIIIR